MPFKDPEKKREQQRRYRKNNPEKMRAYEKRSYHKNKEKNKEKRKIQKREWVLANPEKDRIIAKRWYDKNRKKPARMPKVKPNDVFGKLTVIKEFTRFSGGGRRWTCLCECGNTSNSAQASLLKGAIKSCGCAPSVYDIFRRRRAGYPDDFNITKNNEKERKKNFIYVLNNKIKNRDNNECQLCGETNKLNVHHIIPWRIKIGSRFDEINLVTLCRTCHTKKAHDKGFSAEVNQEVASQLTKIVLGKYPNSATLL